MITKRSRNVVPTVMRVITSVLLAVSMGFGVAAQFLPLWSLTLDEDKTYYYLWYRKVIQPPNSTVTTPSASVPCGLAGTLFRLSSLFSVISIGFLFCAFVVSIAHVVYRPKYGCCLIMYCFMIPGLLLLEASMLLAYYLYYQETCTNSSDWASFDNQNYHADFGLGALLYSSVAAAGAFIFEFFS